MLADTALLPPWGILAPFLAAALALNLTPGADMTYVMARSVSQGRNAGLVSALSITAGSLVHTIAAAIGLAAVIAASPAAFLAVKYAGAAYLFYLAIKMWTSRVDPVGERLPATSLNRVFWEGVMVNVLNPKVALFMLAFLPQFVDPVRGDPVIQIIVLATLFNLGGTLVNVVVALVISAGAARVRDSVRFQKIANRVAGTVLGLLALRLALIERG